jgi:hypothetical protein
MLRQRVKPNNHQSENEEIEVHIECVQPKILSDNRLVFSPWKQCFQTPNNQRKQGQSPKIILVPRLVVIIEGYFTDNPAPIITDGIYYDFKKFAHSVSGKLTPFTSIEVPIANSQTIFI